MRKYCLSLTFCISALSASAQKGYTEGAVRPDSATFCKTVRYTLAESSIAFVHIKGILIDTNASALVYSAVRGVARAGTSSVIDDGELKYEGIMYQGGSKEKMSETYGYYKTMLDNCLAVGYDPVTEKNPEKLLLAFPCIRYSSLADAGHCALSVEYTDVDSQYTVFISVNK